MCKELNDNEKIDLVMIQNMGISELAQRLRMFNLEKNYQDIIKNANSSNPTYEDFVKSILTEEMNATIVRYSKNRIRRSQIKEGKNISNFELNHFPQETISLIRNLYNLDFVDSNKNILLIGSHGTGKTHLGYALIDAICYKGKTGYATCTKNMCRELVLAHKLGNWNEIAKTYLNCDVLFLMDVGTITLEREEVEALYEIIALRDGKGSIIIESCFSPKDWLDRMNHDKILVTGITDRLFEHGVIVKLEVGSYRLKGINNN